MDITGICRKSVQPGSHQIISTSSKHSAVISDLLTNADSYVMGLWVRLKWCLMKQHFHFIILDSKSTVIGPVLTWIRLFLVHLKPVTG